MIKVQNLCVGYGNQQVLNKLNLEFAKGGFYALIGPNGAGKSTLLKTISGWLTPASGQVLLNGKPLAQYGKKQAARLVSFVEQDWAPQFAYTVKEVVLLGRYPHLDFWGSYTATDHKAAQDAIDLLELQALAHKPITGLSGGERQRTLVARALAANTEALLLDESFSHLDMHHQAALMRELKRINAQGRLIVLVSHNLNLAAEFCTQAVMMNNGQIQAVGTTAEVFTQELITRVYARELMVGKNPVSGNPQIFYK